MPFGISSIFNKKPLPCSKSKQNKEGLFETQRDFLRFGLDRNNKEGGFWKAVGFVVLNVTDRSLSDLQEWL